MELGHRRMMLPECCEDSALCAPQRRRATPTNRPFRPFSKSLLSAHVNRKYSVAPEPLDRFSPYAQSFPVHEVLNCPSRLGTLSFQLSVTSIKAKGKLFRVQLVFLLCHQMPPSFIARSATTFVSYVAGPSSGIVSIGTTVVLSSIRRRPCCLRSAIGRKSFRKFLGATPSNC